VALSTKRRRLASSVIALPTIFLAVLASHYTLLRLPYFWDEGGYYVPAAWDFFRTGSLIPQTTMSNAHPPLPMVLMAGWWKIFGFHVLATRVLVCLVAATALLAVFRLARAQLGTLAAAATTLLTAIYPIWFAQSTLAHADIFAAAFTLWALVAYLDPAQDRPVATAILFSLAALSKETAIVTPLALAALEAVLASGVFIRLKKSVLLSGAQPSRRTRFLFQSNQTLREPDERRAHLPWIAALAAPVFPLIAWYAYHRAKTGFIFGNPEFLRYNATANLGLHRILLCLYHRVIHLTMHMNMFVALLCALAAAFMPVVANRARLSRPFTVAIVVVLVANTLEFSVLGGALLTRYLLPMYPLFVLLCVALWQRHLRQWGWLFAFTAAAFLAGIWINPPYAFAPEDNLTYRDMIVLHQQAIDYLNAHYPQATVLTAWPASAELERPELGYTTRPFKYVPLENFSLPQIQKAAADPGAYDTALLFSTKWAPSRNALSLSRHGEQADAKYFDFHLDLLPDEAAILLHGEVVWRRSRGGEWAAILRFPRIVDASLVPHR
jgi:4-amino-4-deoxy-L-arabinose transferase-like glycosyltransferase